jgi:hypothetical protein
MTFTSELLEGSFEVVVVSFSIDASQFFAVGMIAVVAIRSLGVDRPGYPADCVALATPHPNPRKTSFLPHNFIS